MDDTTHPDRLFACLLKQKEEAERDGSEFDEKCARVIVQRLRTRAHGLITCVSVCLSVCLCAVTLQFHYLEIVILHSLFIPCYGRPI